MILRPLIPDPGGVDLLLQGELLRDSALSWSLGAFGAPGGDVLPPLSPMALATGPEPSAFLELATGLSNFALLCAGREIRANAGISCGGGTWLPTRNTSIIEVPFVQATDRWRLTGVTYNNLGTVVVPGCRVVALEVGRIEVNGAPVVAETISDGAGAFVLEVPHAVHYVLFAYLPGSPDRGAISTISQAPDPI